MTNSVSDGSESLLADEPFRVDITHSERVFEGAVWDIRREEFSYNGSTIRRDYTDHTGAVAILAVDEQDRVLLIQQYRHPIRSREWEIPAGLLDITGEDLLIGAKRELAEEADLRAEKWSLLTDFATSPGGSDEYVRIYLARGLSATTETFERTEEEADIVVRWVPLADAVDAVRENRLHNSILQLAVLHAQLAKASGWSTLANANAPWPGTPRGGK